MEGFRDELTQAEAELDSVSEDMKADAQRRLGRLYNAADYPPRVQSLFGVAWDFPSVEPPAYLLRISPEIYEQERQRLAARFEEAVRLLVGRFDSAGWSSSASVPAAFGSVASRRGLVQ